jgi:hypothetical protein
MADSYFANIFKLLPSAFGVSRAHVCALLASA